MWKSKKMLKTRFFLDLLYANHLIVLQNAVVPFMGNRADAELIIAWSCKSFLRGVEQPGSSSGS